jgi:adenylate kinase
MNLVLIGAQGSGKGTQASLLVEKLHIQHVSSGDLLRDAVKQGTPLGNQAKQYMDRGELVPDSLIIQMILTYLERAEFAKGVILDGFPRTRDQAQTLDAALPTDRAINKAIYLNVPRDMLFARLSGRYVCVAHQHVYNIRTKPPKVALTCDIDGSELIQRSDDTPAVIEKRLKDFFELTLQVVHYYRAQQKLVEIDGSQSIDAVSADLMTKLGLEALTSAEMPGQQHNAPGGK